MSNMERDILEIYAEGSLGDGKGSGYNSIIHDAPGANLHSLTKDFAKKIGGNVYLYVSAMEKILKQLNMPLPLSLSEGDIIKDKSPWEIMPVGHKIKIPAPLFTELTNEQVEFFSNKFVGSQVDHAERAMKKEAEAKKVTKKLNTTKIIDAFIVDR
ncbi:hypothetical protein Tco_0573521 [Tanacetum coccineum]